MELKPTDPITGKHLSAVRKDGLSFMVCLHACVDEPELLAQFDRLYGTNIRLLGTPIERAIDVATGRQKSDIEQFLRFVWNCIFLRTPEIETGQQPQNV